MKFKVKKGTTVLSHTEGEPFNVRTFSPLPTEINVTFDGGDVWFIPGVRSVAPSGDLPGNDELGMVRRDTDQKWYEYMIGNFFGFKLPENKKNIDYIIVPKAEVEMVKSKEDVDSHVSDSDKTIRTIRKQTGDFWVPGGGIKRS